MDTKNKSIETSKVIFISIVAFVVIGILIYPKPVFESSKDGLLLWFNTVLPSLFPFMVGTYLLIELGIVNFMGVLFEPIMRPLFNVPGIGAFAWIMGLVSGYPIGAKITADLRANGNITRVEAQRLITFSNNGGPLFILGAVSVGILNKPELRLFLLFIHYLSALSMGIVFRFYKKETTCKKTFYKNLFKKALNQIILKQKKEPKKIGLILKESIMHSMEIIVQVGGFIILFSVLSELLREFLILDLLTRLLEFPFYLMGFNKDLISGLVLGIIEITNGIKILGASSAPLYQQLALINFVIAFGGISIFTQTLSVINHSDIKPPIYALSKIFQAILAFVYTMIFYPYIEGLTHQTKMVFNLFQATYQSNIWLQTWTHICAFLCVFFILINVRMVFRRKS